MADHPRSAFHGLNSVRKSLIRRLNSSGAIAMCRFWRFGLKLPIHTPYLKSFGDTFSPYDVTHRPDPVTPKGPFLGGYTSFERFSVKISATVRPGGRIERKNSITKDSQKCYISPIWGEVPTGPIRPKSCMVGDVHDVTTLPSFRLKFSWVTILQGVEFSIFLLIFAWALQQCSAMRCL